MFKGVRLMIEKESRTFRFSNGYVVEVGIANNFRYVNVNGRSFPLMNINLSARQGTIKLIETSFNFDKKVKVLYEEYYCHVVDKDISFDVKAIPCSPKYTKIVVVCDNKQIFSGRQNITFDSLRGIQNFALNKVLEYKARLEKQNKVQGGVQGNMLNKIQGGVQNNVLPPEKKYTAKDGRELGALGIAADMTLNEAGKFNPQAKPYLDEVKNKLVKRKPDKVKEKRIVKDINGEPIDLYDSPMSKIADESTKKKKQTFSDYLLEGLFGKGGTKNE